MERPWYLAEYHINCVSTSINIPTNPHPPYGSYMGNIEAIFREEQLRDDNYFITLIQLTLFTNNLAEQALHSGSPPFYYYRIRWQKKGHKHQGNSFKMTRAFWVKWYSSNKVFEQEKLHSEMRHKFDIIVFLQQCLPLIATHPRDTSTAHAMAAAWKRKSAVPPGPATCTERRLVPNLGADTLVALLAWQKSTESSLTLMWIFQC